MAQNLPQDHKHVDSLNEEEKIDHKEKGNILSLRERIWDIKLHPDKIRDFFHRHEVKFGYVFLVVVAFLVLGNYLKVKAEIAIFYPQICLGGWENSYKAQGLPETKNDPFIAEFSSENSAILQDTNGQIFCGEFAGQIPEDALPKKFILKLIMKVVTEPIPDKTPLPNLDEIIQETEKPLLEVIRNLSDDLINNDQTEALQKSEISTPEIVPSVPIGSDDALIPENIEIENSILENNQTPAEVLPTESIELTEPVNEPSVEDSPISFLKRITKNVFAEMEENILIEETATAQEGITPEEVTTTEAVFVTEEIPSMATSTLVGAGDASSKEIIEPIKIFENTEIIQSPSEISISSAENEGFLFVSYTLNGVNWVNLGRIGKIDAMDFFVEIPFDDLDWGNMSKVQINLSLVPTIDKLPIIYLDGMWIETEYTEITDSELLSKEIPEEQLILPLSVKLEPNPDKSVRAELRMGDIGSLILSEKINKKSFYYIFSSLDRDSEGSYCAKFFGREWITSEPPFTYGTCFGNDTGEFEIIETTEDMFWNYTDFDPVPEKVLSRNIFTIPENLIPLPLVE